MRNIDSLKNTSQFKEVYEHGRSAANGLLVVYVLAVEGNRQRLGISVSKKVGNSVIRHRITRLIRESFVQIRGCLPEGYSFVVVARGRAAQKNYSDICNALVSLMKRLDIYPDSGTEA